MRRLGPVLREQSDLRQRLGSYPACLSTPRRPSSHPRGFRLFTCQRAVLLKSYAGSLYTSADAQLPYLLSGGAVGIGLIVFGAALLVLGQVRADRLKDEARFMRMLDARSESSEEAAAASPRTAATQPTVTLPELTPATTTAEAMPVATAAE